MAVAADRAVLDEAGDRADLLLAGTAFDDDWGHAYVESSKPYDPAQLLNQLTLSDRAVSRIQLGYQSAVQWFAHVR